MKKSTSRIGRSVKRVLKNPRAAWLARRTQVRWRAFAQEFQKLFGIFSQVPVKVYRKFIAEFNPKKIGKFKVQMRKGSGEGLVMLAITKWEKKVLGHTMKESRRKFVPKRVQETKIIVPSNLFRMKFVLTSEIEPDINLPIDRNSSKPICAITGMQGPSKRKFDKTLKVVDDVNWLLGRHWQTFMLREMIEHARAQGFQAVALLRPEHHPDLTKEHLAEFGAGPISRRNIANQFFSAAKDNKMRKVKNSKYMWIVFEK